MGTEIITVPFRSADGELKKFLEEQVGHSITGVDIRTCLYRFMEAQTANKEIEQ